MDAMLTPLGCCIPATLKIHKKSRHVLVKTHMRCVAFMCLPLSDWWVVRGLQTVCVPEMGRKIFLLLLLLQFSLHFS